MFSILFTKKLSPLYCRVTTDLSYKPQKVVSDAMLNICELGRNEK